MINRRDAISGLLTMGAMMYCEGNRLHGIKNTVSTPMGFYFCKWLGSEAV